MFIAVPGRRGHDEIVPMTAFTPPIARAARVMAANPKIDLRA